VCSFITSMTHVDPTEPSKPLPSTPSAPNTSPDLVAAPPLSQTATRLQLPLSPDSPTGWYTAKRSTSMGPRSCMMRSSSQGASKSEVYSYSVMQHEPLLTASH